MEVELHQYKKQDGPKGCRIGREHVGTDLDIYVVNVKIEHSFLLSRRLTPSAHVPGDGRTSVESGKESGTVG